jgi:DNA polymerase eta
MDHEVSLSQYALNNYPDILNSALVDLDVDETEEDDPDWDDIAILIGSDIIRSVRAAIREKLKYTCSGGIAQNKMLSKLGSAHKKPNQQTVIRNRAVQKFLSDFKFTKIRGLGGKLGEQITSAFNTDTVKELLPVSLEQLKSKLGADTGTWVYEIIRGNDSSEVNSRTQIKSMLSAKSFRPSINTPEQAHRWLRIFAADIYSRLVEEGVLENKRRPNTINLHHRQGGQTKSRQAPIPMGKKIDELAIFELAKNLLGQINLEGGVWPCSNLSLSVGGFEDGIVGNMGIGGFLVKCDPKPSITTRRDPGTNDGRRIEGAWERPEKRRRVEETAGIGRFFVKSNSNDEHDDDFGAQLPGMESRLDEGQDADEDESVKVHNLPHEATELHNQQLLPTSHLGFHQPSIVDYMCSRCNQALQSADALQSHQDWHMAKDLEDEDRKLIMNRSSTTIPNKKPGSNSSKKKATRGKPEKGQSKLAFG